MSPCVTLKVLQGHAQWIWELYLFQWRQIHRPGGGERGERQYECVWRGKGRGESACARNLDWNKRKGGNLRTRACVYCIVIMYHITRVGWRVYVYCIVNMYRITSVGWRVYVWLLDLATSGEMTCAMDWVGSCGLMVSGRRTLVVVSTMFLLIQWCCSSKAQVTD